MVYIGSRKNMKQRAYTTNFSLVGGRSYIQGIAILEFISDCVHDAALVSSEVELFVDTAKFVRKTDCNGHVRVLIGDEGSMDIEGAACILSGSLSDGRRVNGCFCPQESNPVKEYRDRDAFELTNINLLEDYSGTAQATWGDRLGLLRSIVDIQKKLILATYQDNPNVPVVEIVQVEGLTIPQSIKSGRGLVVVDNLSARMLGQRLYILNEVISDNWVGSVFKFTYSVQSDPS